MQRDVGSSKCDLVADETIIAQPSVRRGGVTGCSAFWSWPLGTCTLCGTSYGT